MSSSTTACSGPQREKNVYISESNRLEIEFVQNRDPARHGKFLIKFKLLGCADPELLGNALVERSVDKAVLECEGSEQTYTFHCHGNQWDGVAQECSSSP